MLTKTVLLLNVSHIQLNYACCVVLKHFLGKFTETSLFSQKKRLSERSSEILRRFLYLNTFEKGKT